MEHRRQTAAGLHPTDLAEGIATRHRSSRLAVATFALLFAVALLGISASVWVVVVDGASLIVLFVVAAFLAATAVSMRAPGHAPAGR